MTALHDTSELSCPRCGASLADLEEEVRAPVSGTDDQIRIGVECSSCTAPLELVRETALPEAIGVDVWVEDRRDDE